MAKRTIAVHLQQVLGIYIACKYKCKMGEVQLGPLTHWPYDDPDCARACVVTHERGGASHRLITLTFI